MKKTKIKQRIVNAADAFFADEDCDENKLMSFGNENKLWRETKYEDSAHRSSSLKTVLKQVLLFFPGTFVLHILSMAFTAIFISGFFRTTKALSFYEFMFSASVFLAVTLMTWVGLGDVRKPKHLVIPVSIISVGVIASGLFLASNYFQTSIHYDALPFYTFPLALIAPFLAKGWVDKDS